MVNLNWDRESLEEEIDNAFSGSPNGLGTGAYRKTAHLTLYKLLENGHDISAYLALSSFIDEALSDLAVQRLDKNDNASNGEIESIETRTSLEVKTDLLRIQGVINKETSNAIKEFKQERNKFAHNASSHVYPEENEAHIRKCFRRGLDAYEKLMVKLGYNTAENLKP